MTLPRRARKVMAASTKASAAARRRPVTAAPAANPVTATLSGRIARLR